MIIEVMLLGISITIFNYNIMFLRKKVLNIAETIDKSFFTLITYLQKNKEKSIDDINFNKLDYLVYDNSLSVDDFYKQIKNLIKEIKKSVNVDLDKLNVIHTKNDEILILDKIHTAIISENKLIEKNTTIAQFLLVLARKKIFRLFCKQMQNSDFEGIKDLFNKQETNIIVH